MIAQRVWRLALFAVMTVSAQDVLTPEGKRIPMEKLIVRAGQLCLPQDTSRCYANLPLAPEPPSPWSFELNWVEDGAGVISDSAAWSDDTATSYSIHSSLLFQTTYAIRSGDWTWKPQMALWAGRVDSITSDSVEWEGGTRLGLGTGAGAFNINVSLTVERSGDGDTLWNAQAYTSWMMSLSSNDVLVFWGQGRHQWSTWEALTGFSVLGGVSWFHEGNPWRFEVTPSLQAQLYPSTESAQSSAVALCSGLDSAAALQENTDLVCYDSTGLTAQTLNSFKGILGYEHPLIGPDAPWNTPGTWWMPELSLEMDYQISSNWALTSKAGAGVKFWPDAYVWNNAAQGAEMADSSGNIALFQDTESGNLYLLSSDGSETWIPWEVQRQTRRDFLANFALGFERTMGAHGTLGLEAYVLGSRTNLPASAGIQSYLVGGINFSLKGLW
ncbi:MAG TPA: hypothetical protein VLM37_05270 [Fibrobacteraceae bacterium]|nr:hypothetical protein [Fibrobacteraceae bacterium]